MYAVHGEPPDFIDGRLLDGVGVYLLSMFQHLMNMLINSFSHIYQNNWIVVQELI